MTQPGLPRNLGYRRNEVESCVANAHRGVNAVTLSTVPVVGFRDRDQYIQRSSDTPPLDTSPFDTPSFDAPPSDTAPAAFFVSTQTGYREPSNNGPSSLSGEPPGQLPPAFPQPQCSCEPSSLENSNHPTGSRSSLPYFEITRDTAESSLPQALPSNQQPEDGDGTLDHHGVNNTVADPVAGSNASSHTAGGQSAAQSVLITVPATLARHVTSSTAAAGQVGFIRSPGTFGSTEPDPLSIRARSGRYIVEEDYEDEDPPEDPKPGVLSRFFSWIFK